MGLFDGLFGGGSETQQQELPSWIERPAKEISGNIQNTFVSTGRPPLNQQQRDALRAMEAQARGGNPLLQQGGNFMGQLFSQGGMTGGQTQLANQLLGGQLNNPATGMAGNVAGGGLNYANPALQETMRVAYGGDVGRNPWLDRTFNRSADVMGQNFRENVIPGMDTGFASQGRLGSNRYAGARNQAEDAYGRQLNDLATGIYGGAYGQDMAAKNAMLQQFGGLGEAGLGRQMEGLGMYGNLNAQNVQQRLQGAGLDQQGIQNLFTGMGQLPGMQNLRYDDMQRLFGAGTTREDARYAEANRAAQALGGLHSPTSQTTTANPNVGSQILGLGATALGAYMGSDRRIKKDVRRTGALPSGLPTYTFRYAWEQDNEPLHDGVMADEAVVLFPNAVGWHPIGYATVDYARIG